ncbi:MAG: SDR family oxidoreductase [Armatimonadota bacterium]|nr:SDR family oxidoreductase [Armatimonadota bacterium]MDR7443544.1 SDR family oxidoreductase [Armatimonadota bacterium]MDR7570960.1 SDR family oxidoreductase [Armatimonadota bacterium]MDR7615042.1 SDR family oxidoreductase [Armatimonadota bacterium]
MAYLVTGGAGFIGSHVVEALYREGKPVRVLDDLSTGSLRNLEEALGLARGSLRPPPPGQAVTLAEGCEFVLGDIRDPEVLRRACAGVEVVIHEAALRAVPRSVVDPLSTDDVNVSGTLKVLLAAREAGVRRVVFASSSSVYGASLEVPKVEGMTPAPVSPYAVSKLAGEHYCRVFYELYGLETVSLRYFNVFGPRQDPASEYAAVIPKFILAALQGRPVEIHGDGLQSRDFTYVTNAVRATLLAAAVPEAAGEVLNVGAGETYSVLQVVEALEQILGRRLEVHHTAPRPGDVRVTLADTSRARRVLGYGPHVGFVEGLRETVRYFAARHPTRAFGKGVAVGTQLMWFAPAETSTEEAT